MTTSFTKVFSGSRDVAEYGADRNAGVELRTVGTSSVALSENALADLAQVAAIVAFYTFDTAAETIDMFRANRGVVSFRPKLGSFLSQGIVIEDGGPAGIAVFAIQPAAGYQFFHND